MTNSTIAANVADKGAGIFANGSTHTVTNSTISGNDAIREGGGIYYDFGTLNLASTIVAGNDGSPIGDDIYSDYGPITSQGYNLIGSSAGASGFDGTNLTDGAAFPLNLGGLANNGGPTQTMALGAGSIAINRGNPAFVPPPDFDQCGAYHARSQCAPACRPTCKAALSPRRGST